VENLTELMQGFGIALTLPHIGIMIAGVLFGILVGVLPGLGAPNGVSLLLPLTFGMDPVSAIILLASMYWGALFGGSVTSILFNIPASPHRSRRRSTAIPWRATGVRRRRSPSPLARPRSARSSASC
jgi:TctA family transporter